MPINVNSAIDMNTGEKIIIKRKTGGKYVDGLYVQGRIKAIKAIASQQVATPEEIQLVSGLERAKDVKIFYVNKPIIASDHFDNEEADIIIWKTKEYKTVKSKDWDSYGYNVVIGARIT